MLVQWHEQKQFGFVKNYETKLFLQHGSSTMLVVLTVVAVNIFIVLKGHSDVLAVCSCLALIPSGAYNSAIRTQDIKKKARCSVLIFFG